MENNNDEVALLMGQTGPLNGQRWALGDIVLIGRDESCDIVIPDRQVSRHHAQITMTPQGLLLEDLNSKNGTHLNGKQLAEPTILGDGDSIQIAVAQKFVFLSSDATVPLAQDFARLPLDRQVNGPIEGSGMKKSGSGASPIHRLHLDKRAHRVWIRLPKRGDRLDGQVPVETEVDPPLSASQFRLLEILFDQQGEVVSRQDLVAEVWGAEEAIGVSEQALDALIRRLRDRLANVDPTHNYIITVRGHGLRLDNTSAED